jgi:isopenicillin N synthase-like dioxygenase
VTSALSVPAATMPEAGTSTVATDEATAAAIHALFAEAHRFFEGPAEYRERYAAGPTMTGWRRVGIEYSQSPDRPDLNETFCYRRHDDTGTLAEHPLLDAARAVQEGLDVAAAEVLQTLAEQAGVAGRVEKVRTSQESWLQLNFSRPSTAPREFIQDAHEDGHLVTFLVADAPGLDVHTPTEGWIALTPTPERPIVFAGECGALLTGDLVRPTPHRVRALRGVLTRLSVAYFVNPDLDQDLAPWVRTSRNEHVDLLRWGQQNPARFGLPTL